MRQSARQALSLEVLLRLGRVLLPLLTVGLVAPTALAVPAAAAATEVCSPTPRTDSSFCVSADIAVVRPGTDTPATLAGEPADLVASAANTSTSHASDKNVWLKTLTLSFVNPLGGDVYTPSAQLDDDLIVAGTAAGCAPGGDSTFSSCTAGHGTAYVDVSNTGFEDGIHTATFGIQRITNVNPPAEGAALDWVVTVDVCVSSGFGSCFPSAQTQQFEVIADQAALTAGTVTFDTTLSGAYDANYGFGTAHVTFDGAIDTMSLHLLGESDQTAGGDAPGGSQRVMHLPTRCGTAAAKVSAASRADATVTLSRQVPVSGCPTARMTAAFPAPYRVTLNGSTSSTPLPGRSIVRWRWTFGDGTSKVTTSPKVSHTYANSRDRIVRLVAVDNLGALSNSRSRLLKGSTLTIASKATAVPGTKVALSGRLTRWHTTTGLAGRTLRLERCRADGTHCALIKTVTTSSTGRWSAKAVFKATKPRFRISFAGGKGFLGTRASRRVARA